MIKIAVNEHIFMCKKHEHDIDPDCLTCSMAKAENAHIGMMMLNEDEDEEADDV